MSQRNRLVYAAAHACGARLVATMGGGYPRNLDPASAPFQEMIHAHMDVYRDLVTVFAPNGVADNA